MQERFEFPSATGQGLIQASVYAPEHPRAVLQLCHGMQEYFDRYHAFIERMNDAGFAVIGHDHAGHGRSGENCPRGYFGTGNGWNALISDIETFRSESTRRWPSLPAVLMGHSMGSFLARSAVARHPDGWSAAVFMGTSGPLPAHLIVPLTKLFRGTSTLSRLQDLMNGVYCKRIRPRHALSDWLSRDTESNARFLADPLYFPCFTAGGYRALFTGLSEVSSRRWATRMPKTLPVLLLSGEEDPIGQYGRGVRMVAARLQKAGVRDVTTLLYPGARHELLNELNRDEVIVDLQAWLAARLFG